MASITTKLVELLRNLKSDAVPKPPRTEQAEVDPTTDDGPINLEPGDSPQSHKKQTDEDEDHEEIVFGDDDFMKEKKNKPHFAFKSKKNKGGGTKEPKGPSSKEKKNGIYSSVNTQATGSVYNVVNSKNVQFGSNNVYYMSATSKNSKEKENIDSDDDKEDDIPKDSCISLLMESDIEPTFKYMSFISKNLGRDWKAFYASLGYLKGYIDTLVEESGIIEARYRLLDDWAKNDKDGSLGRLATLLWEAGERRIVRELSLIYKHTDPNYSCAYVTTRTEDGRSGYGLTFTCGRGTEVVVLAVRSLRRYVLGRNAADIFADFSDFWRAITNESQLRWIGPEKGASHLAAAAILNSLWDLWARIENKPLWRLLVDMEPEELVSTIDFRYITDVITKEEAIQLLREKQAGKEERVKLLLEKGYPAYTTQVGWMGYSDATVEQLCDKYLKLGFTHFKVKVGVSVEDDLRRCNAVRKRIGHDNVLMVDANQAWSVNEAIEWMEQLAPLKPMWIEEPTSPDDVLGHAAIAKALKPYGIGVATGEMCANRVMFKQFLQSGGMEYCQIDSARVGGINEILSIYLMAEKLKVKVCPHAGGVGLCEMVQHLQLWDFASVSCTMEGRLVEYVDQQHEHFYDPCVVENARYVAPKMPGYSTQFLPVTLEKYCYPNGTEWQRMIKEVMFPPPDEAELVNL